ncbi:MAG: MopE-related protein, partial [Myxococcota bacterium]
YPGATEVWYDGTDQDCDGSDDDQDGDGYARADDCSDTDAAINPGAAEVWYDGTDQDCDGNDDDQDGDGYARVDDCADADAAVNPGAAEVWYDGTDQDCDGNDDDQDADGYALADDCDDTDAAVNPGAAEAWYDGTDQDCDGNDDDRDLDGSRVDADCDDLDASTFPGAVETWYDGIDQDCDGNDLDQDGDGDNYFVDCDDTDPGVFPGATEVWYDGVDQDCDGNDDDQDADGYGGGSGGLDCDDADPTVSPGAAEVWYDGVDQDCDGTDDDRDGDTYARADDCDDTDATVNPAATEVWYDGVDQDCAGDDDDDQDADGHALADDCSDTDAAINPGAPEVWYDGVDQDCDGNDDDQDGDGYALAGDCSDTDAAINPGAPEVWYDGVDQDCDSRDDDQDGDGALAADDCDDTDPAVLRCLERIDGGCNSAGGGPGWLVALVAAVLLRGRRSAPLLLLTTPAWALDATGTGRAPLDEGGLARVAGMAARDGGTLDVALTGGWAGTTAEATYDDGSTAPLMSGLATLHLGVGWTFLDGLRVEAGLPMVLGAVVPAETGPGVGDAWAAVHWAALRRDRWAFGPVLEVTLPSGDPTRLSGGGGVGGALLVGASGRSGRVRWSGEVGGGARAAGRYDRLSFAPEPELRAGGGARVGIFGPLSVGVEVAGRFGFGAENAVALATSGAEGLLSLGVDLPRVDLMLSGGAGLLDGVGTPDARVILSVRSRLVDPRPRFADDDQDGVADATDRCPGEREDDDGFQDEDGCLDADDDADGLPDDRDRCPSDPEDRDYFRDDDGCPDLDDDEDGLPDTVDRCARDAGPPETNGCPDRDFDGLLDPSDACPDDAAIPGTDLAHTDGCPATVVVFPDRLHVTDPIPFDPGRATLRPEGASVVRQVAVLLKRYPDLALVEIGVHVDESADEASNLALTQARAEVVKKALEAAGVAPERLVAMGYGGVRPLAPNDTEVDRARNRRVEFVLVGR